MIKLQKFLSTVLGYFVIAMAGLGYVNQLWREPFEKFIPIGLTAFGIISVLSALCFTLVSCIVSEDEKKSPMYSGKRFFQACLFLLQAIFFKFVGEQIINWHTIESVTWLRTQIGYFINFLSSVAAGWATWSSLYAFDELNKYFWNQYSSSVKKQKITKEKNNAT